MAEHAKGLDVNVPMPEHVEMMKGVRLSRALLSGSAAMRSGLEAWTPIYKAEKHAAYHRRKDATFLYPGLKRAIRNHAGKVHSEPIHRHNDLPDLISDQLNNVDGQGTSLDAWSPHVYRAGEADGLTHILVDQRPLPVGATLGDAQVEGVRPFWIHLTVDDLIGWLYHWGSAGLVLDQIRFRQRVRLEAAPGSLQAIVQNQVRIITPGSFELWVQPDPDEELFVLKDFGNFDLDVIPLSTFYANPTGVLTGKPTWQELEDKNLEHWQSTSAQRNALTFSRVPFFWGAGVPPDKEPNAFGSSVAFFLEDKDATLALVETNGKPIEAGRLDLEDLKADMHALGLLPMSTKFTGDVKATFATLLAAEAEPTLQVLSIGYSEALSLAAKFQGMWQKLEVPAKALSTVRDFNTIGTTDDMGTVIAVLEATETLTEEAAKQILLAEAARRDLILDDAETKKLAEELVNSTPTPSSDSQREAMLARGMRLMDQGASLEEALAEVRSPNLTDAAAQVS